MSFRRSHYALILSIILIAGCNGSDSDSTITIPKEETHTTAESFNEHVAATGEIKPDQTITLDLPDNETYKLEQDLTVKGNLTIK
ncbi:MULTISPECIES: hypothetical protein [Photobacterium]|jgi:uncharacterized lipoprotein|uniref:Uncharacterized protein n=2 Tax=Photobacterium TaxID=657 RepID=A0A2T3JU61_PHOPO|nr:MULTISPECIES: hypothetical protein [Photobacterium]MCD9509953.1 hypothetical protein [Photobacterium phosphoreum]MCD9519249.1 hypothetical protein [Photobacterium phosphoreum]MEC6898075.1 hypothetical protein [Photobacterium piscicola]PSU24064.1 hypothetical protein CTM96_13315 [Photobacterium phosphoreum]PSU43677.1 hypothetical protein CTM97_02970 [Photobacterium phosphoreum]